MGKTVVHGGDIRPSSSRAGYRKRRAVVSSEEEQPRVFQARIRGFLLVRIDVVKNGLTACRPRFEIEDSRESTQKPCRTGRALVLPAGILAAARGVRVYSARLSEPARENA